MSDRNLLSNKRAQVADTMTWVVATIIIVVVLGISIIATNFVVSSQKPIFLDDKKKEFLATKSITSFLTKKENVDLLKNEDYKSFGNHIVKLLEISRSNFLVKGGDELFTSTTTTSTEGKWALKLYENEEIKYETCEHKNPFLATNLFLNKLKLEFWFTPVKTC